MARFHYPVSITAEEKALAESNSYGTLPEGSNLQFCHEFFETLEDYETKHLEREECYCGFKLPGSS
jgi:hypothetical protein